MSGNVNRIDKSSNHSTWDRLEDQLTWYEGESLRSQKCYKFLKALQLIFAVSIPIVSHLEPSLSKWITSILGASIALFEGVQHMNQYSIKWITYRSTAEHLKHEKYLFLSYAGPYRGMSDKEMWIVLSERVEESVSTEHANWITATKQTAAKEV